VDGLALPLLPACGDGEGDAAEEDEAGKRDEGALVAPEDDEEAREERAEGVAEALELLRAAGLIERLVIDASHDNSGKDTARQLLAAGEIADQVADGNAAIAGVMLESFLVEGHQDLGEGELVYGQSITDPCLDWEATVSVLDQLASAARARRGE